MKRFFVLVLFLGAAGCWLDPTPQPPATRGRKILLEGVANARELGGIPVKGGRVRPGLVYRTNALDRLSDMDVKHLSGIRTVVDLRLPKEHAQAPDREDFLSTVANVRWLRMNVQNTPDGYRSVPPRHAREFRQLFHIFSQQESYPVLYHCAAGKDRTGIVTALLLELLGAERREVVADYLASNESGPSFQVDVEWITAVLVDVDQAGGIDPYLDRLGIPAADREAIRALLIAPRDP